MLFLNELISIPCNFRTKQPVDLIVKVNIKIRIQTIKSSEEAHHMPLIVFLEVIFF